VLIAAALVILAAGGVYYWQSMKYESTDDAQVDGFIYPISARVAGHVAKVYFDDHQYVTAGTVLVELDPKDYDVAVAAAAAAAANSDAIAAEQTVTVPIVSADTESRLSTASAGIENEKAGLAMMTRQFEAAQATLREARANDQRAQDDVKRYEPLAARDEIPQQQYTRAVDAQKATAAAVDAASAAVAAAEQSIVQARTRVSRAQAEMVAARTRPEQIASQRAHAEAARAEGDRARAVLAQARLNRQYTTIVAPVSGIVGQRSVQPGQNITAGQQLMTVVPLDRQNLWVTANFKETQLRHMRPGQPATLTIDTSGRTYRGRVLNIAGASGARYSLLPPENATGNYVKVVQRIPVRITFDPGQDTTPLRLGMSVEPSVRVR
jgi:membrane fusion protein (multidrug efflux system)